KHLCTTRQNISFNPQEANSFAKTEAKQRFKICTCSTSASSGSRAISYRFISSSASFTCFEDYGKWKIHQKPERRERAESRRRREHRVRNRRAKKNKICFHRCHIFAVFWQFLDNSRQIFYRSSSFVFLK